MKKAQNLWMKHILDFNVVRTDKSEIILWKCRDSDTWRYLTCEPLKGNRCGLGTYVDPTLDYNWGFKERDYILYGRGFL